MTASKVIGHWRFPRFVLFPAAARRASKTVLTTSGGRSNVRPAFDRGL
jgi:hypothetical protein